MPTVFTPARYTAAEPQIPRGVIVAYAATVRMPAEAPSQKAWSIPPSSPSHPDPSVAHSLPAWPMQIVVRGFVEDDFAIDCSFWVSAAPHPVPPPAAALSETSVGSQTISTSVDVTNRPVRTIPSLIKAAVLAVLANGEAMTAWKIAESARYGFTSVRSTLLRLTETGEVSKVPSGYQISRTPPRVPGPDGE